MSISQKANAEQITEDGRYAVIVRCQKDTGREFWGFPWVKAGFCPPPELQRFALRPFENVGEISCKNLSKTRFGRAFLPEVASLFLDFQAFFVYQGWQLGGPLRKYVWPYPPPKEARSREEVYAPALLVRSSQTLGVRGEMLA